MFNEKEQEIINWGLKNGKSKDEVQRAITNYRLGLTSEKKEKEQTFLQDTVSDVKQVGSEIVGSAKRRSDTTMEAIQAGKEGKQGLLRTAGQVFGQGAGFASDIIGSTFKGVVKAVLPQKTETAIKGGIQKVAEPVMNTELVKGILQKYNSLDEKTKRDIDAAVGVASLAADVAGAGVAIKGVKTGVRAGAKVAIKAADTATDLAKGLGNILVKGKSYSVSRVPKILGIFSGESDTIIQQALKNPQAARLGLSQGDEALRLAVREGAEKSIQLRSAFTKAYTQAKSKVLGQYTKTLLNKNEVKNQFKSLLEGYGVKIKGNSLDFTTSKIIANPGEVSNIEKAWAALNRWDKNLTIDSLDEYKQLVGQLTKFAKETGGSSKSPVLGSLYNSLNNVARSKLPKDIAEKYFGLNKKFSEGIELYNDMVDAFNSGDPFTRLANALGKNKDTLKQVIEFYEARSGSSVLPIVAGRELAMEKQAAFGFLNPRSWIDFFISPELQGKAVLRAGQILPKQ